MTLTLDNLDALGAVDYTAAIDRSAVFTITRSLNRPSTLKGMICLEAIGLRVPLRQARVVVASESDTLLFTGYLAVEPVAVYAGVASAGPVYRWRLEAVSDEWLLDKQSAGTAPGPGLNQAAGGLFKQLVTRLAPGRLSTAGVANGSPVGVFSPAGGSAVWSAHAGSLAATTAASYRALNGGLSLTPVGSVSHVLAEGDGTLTLAGLQQSAVRELANDVMLSGAIEPRAYWTELFQGDGSTTIFPLAGEPSANSGGHATLIADSFATTTLNPNVWALTDPGSHLSLTGATTSGGGLTLNGGNGLDGQTTVIAYDQFELGGTMVIELGAVQLASGSAGMLAGLYAGTPVLANCVAGFNVTQTVGATILAPVVNGMVTGTPFTIAANDFYTLRLHLHCPELLRVKQAYYALGNSFGGGLVNAPLAMVFEIRDQGASSNTPVTVLYDGAMQSSPAQASFVLVNALELFGAIGSVAVTRTGSAWITSTPPGAATETRLVGKAAQGADCSLSASATGQATFFPGRIPVAGESIAISYRGRARSVARLADPTSLAAEAAGGSVGTARWVGKVLQPAARSTEDCENAAAAILSFSTSRAAAVTGSYRAIWRFASNLDLWPGDVLTLTSASTISVIARAVTIEDHGASPEALTYRIAFANNWAEGLSLTLSESFAADATPAQLALDLIPSAGPGLSATIPPHVLGNLQQMTVAAATSSLAVDSGLAPPAGGGFEVRRRDAGFGTGPNAAAGSGDLVLRSPVRGFSIPRAAVEETFFVRMYDASSPPLYSRESAAIVTHLPIS